MTHTNIEMKINHTNNSKTYGLPIEVVAKDRHFSKEVKSVISQLRIKGVEVHHFQYDDNEKFLVIIAENNEKEPQEFTIDTACAQEMIGDKRKLFVNLEKKCIITANEEFAKYIVASLSRLESRIYNGFHISEGMPVFFYSVVDEKFIPHAIANGPVMGDEEMIQVSHADRNYLLYISQVGLCQPKS